MRTAAKIVVLALLCATAAYAAKVKVYDLRTGKVSQLEYKNKWWSGHGPIKGTLATGQKVEGEFTTIPKSNTSWGSIYRAGDGVSGTATTVSNDQRGTAIITGDGIVMECEYQVSALSGHGSGYCKDNDGNRYKIMF